MAQCTVKCFYMTTKINDKGIQILKTFTIDIVIEKWGSSS